MKPPLTFLLSLTFLFLFSGSVYGDDFQDGLDAAQRKDYKEAVRLYRLSAEQGDAYAQSNLSDMYRKGRTELDLNTVKTMDQVREILQNYNETIKADMSYSEDELNPENTKQNFIDYYNTNIVQRLKTPVKYIRDEAIHLVDVNWDSELDIIFWTEGVWASLGGISENEFLYVLEMKNGLPVKIIKEKINSVKQKGSSGEYKKSLFYQTPNTGCGYNDFVRGLLIVGDYGASGSASVRYYINYNKWDETVQIEKESSPVFLVPQSCK
jgi:hypothetical protein